METCALVDAHAQPTALLIGGFRVIDTTVDGLIALVHCRLAARERTELVFANTNFIVNCHRNVDALNGATTLIANDGIGMDLAALMLYRKRFTANLNGTDFTPLLLKSFTKSTRVFLLGSTVFAVRAAAKRWGELPHVDIVGALDGFDDMHDEAALLRQVRAAAPDVLLLALGNPRQENWMVAHRDDLDMPLVIGVGALFDFVSGRVARAPRWIRRARLEWLYRLAQEPSRLSKRYSVDLLVFFAHVRRVHRAEKRAAPKPLDAAD